MKRLREAPDLSNTEDVEVVEQDVTGLAKSLSQLLTSKADKRVVADLRTMAEKLSKSLNVILPQLKLIDLKILELENTHATTEKEADEIKAKIESLTRQIETANSLMVSVEPLKQRISQLENVPDNQSDLEAQFLALSIDTNHINKSIEEIQTTIKDLKERPPTYIAGGGISASGTPEANEYARFDSRHRLAGRSIAEVRDDLNLEDADIKTIAKADTDIADAITKKHTQNTDTDLDSTFEATFAKQTDLGTLAASCVVIGTTTSSYVQALATRLRAAGYPVWLSDGTLDNVEIQAALDALPSGGGKVLLHGRFSLGGSGNLLAFAKAYTVLSGLGPGRSGDVELYVANSTNYSAIIKTGYDMCTVENMSLDGNRDNTTGDGRGIDLSGVIDNTVRFCIIYNTRGADIYSYSAVSRMMWMHFVYNNWLEGAPSGTPSIHYSWAAGTPIGSYDLRDSYYSFNIIGRNVLFEVASGRVSGYSYQDLHFIGNKGMDPIELQLATNCTITANNFPSGATGQVDLTNCEGIAIVGNTELAVVNETNCTNIKKVGNPGFSGNDEDVAASATVAGKVELATAAETTTGTDATRAVTPDGLAGSVHGMASIEIQVVATATDVDTTSGIGYFNIPSKANGMILVRAQAYVDTAGTTNATTVQVRNMTKYASNDALSGAISIASGGTVGTVGTIDASYDDVATDDLIKVYVTGQSTTKPKGLRVLCEYQLP